MTNNSRDVTATPIGAVQGAIAAYLFFTDRGRRLWQRIDHALDEMRLELDRTGGLATDYCVKDSVLDALRAGFAVTVLGDAIAGVDVRPGDSARAIAAMQEAGAEIATG